MAYAGAVPGRFGDGGAVRGPTVSVALACAPVGIGASAATERTCHTPFGGSVMLRSSTPLPVEVSSGDPGPYFAPVGLNANTSRSVGTLLVHV